MIKSRPGSIGGARPKQGSALGKIHQGISQEDLFNSSRADFAGSYSCFIEPTYVSYAGWQLHRRK